MLNIVCLDCKKLNNDCKGRECQTWTSCIYKEEKEKDICTKTIPCCGCVHMETCTKTKKLN